MHAEYPPGIKFPLYARKSPDSGGEGADLDRLHPKQSP